MLQLLVLIVALLGASPVLFAQTFQGPTNAASTAGLAKTSFSNITVPTAIQNLGLGRSATKSYGFVNDGQKITSGVSTTAGSNVVAGLTGAVAGQTVDIPGAGTNGLPLITTLTDGSHMATNAAYATSGSTWFAQPGQPCFPSSDSIGTGYAPDDTIALNDGGNPHAVCRVEYTGVNTATIATGGSGCTSAGSDPNGTIIVDGTTGTGSGDEFLLQLTAGVATSVAQIRFHGRFTVNPTLSGEVVTIGLGSCSVLPTLNLQMGVAAAIVTVPGNLPSKPSDPVTQLSSSGGGTGATFMMTNVYTAAGWAVFGTLNSAALTAMLSDTSAPKVRFDSGTYLFGPGNYTAASSISIDGSGMNKTVLMMLPYSQQTGNLIVYNGTPGLSIRDLTFDAEFSYPSSNRAAINFLTLQGADNTKTDHAGFVDFPVWWNLYQATALSSGIHGGALTNSYFQVVNPDITTSNAITLSDGGGGGITSFKVDGNTIVGAGTQFCAATSQITNNTAGGNGYGAPFFTQPNDDANCHDNTIAGNISTGSLLTTDINNTAPNGFEIHGANMQVIGDHAYNCTASCFLNESTGSVWKSDQAHNWGLRADGLPSAGFRSVAANGTNTGTGATFSGDTADYDVGSATAGYGYDEVLSGANTLSGMKMGLNSFSGPAGTANIASSTVFATAPEFAASPVTMNGAVSVGGALSLSGLISQAGNLPSATSAVSLTGNSTATGAFNNININPIITLNAATGAQQTVRSVPIVLPTQAFSGGITGIGNSIQIGNASANAFGLSGRVDIGTDNLQFGSGYTGTLSDADLRHIENPTIGSAHITSLGGLTIDEITAGTNNTDLLIGTANKPSGNFAIWSGSSRASKLAGTLDTTGFSVSGTAGVTCPAGTPSASFAVTNGIVTHC